MPPLRLVRGGGFLFGAAQHHIDRTRPAVLAVSAALAQLRATELERARQVWQRKFGTAPRDASDHARQARFLAARGFDGLPVATVPLWGGQLQAWYHDFDAEQGSTSYGDEIDLSYGHPIPAVPGLTALVKYASYDADTAVLRGNVANVDTDKFWLQLQYTY